MVKPLHPEVPRDAQKATSPEQSNTGEVIDQGRRNFVKRAGAVVGAIAIGSALPGCGNTPPPPPPLTEEELKKEKYMPKDGSYTIEQWKTLPDGRRGTFYQANQQLQQMGAIDANGQIVDENKFADFLYYAIKHAVATPLLQGVTWTGSYARVGSVDTESPTAPPATSRRGFFGNLFRGRLTAVNSDNTRAHHRVLEQSQTIEDQRYASLNATGVTAAQKLQIEQASQREFAALQHYVVSLRQRMGDLDNSRRTWEAVATWLIPALLDIKESIQHIWKLENLTKREYLGTSAGNILAWIIVISGMLKLRGGMKLKRTDETTELLNSLKELSEALGKKVTEVGQSITAMSDKTSAADKEKKAKCEQRKEKRQTRQEQRDDSERAHGRAVELERLRLTHTLSIEQQKAQAELAKRDAALATAEAARHQTDEARKALADAQLRLEALEREREREHQEHLQAQADRDAAQAALDNARRDSATTHQEIARLTAELTAREQTLTKEKTEDEAATANVDAVQQAVTETERQVEAAAEQPPALPPSAEGESPALPPNGNEEPPAEEKEPE
ncbi:MAG: twin-arginine translocation signal domain-containing protein [Candidatus Peribacteraceae bacterium]|nr:twin-arginine translocation signal domain-containing protein [Candidatus Peribacteraceae bacterium]MDD5074679.1 twin-arginine translocation signal domain-containing protein [Candidatus Peribacteraceae bacterium]